MDENIEFQTNRWKVFENLGWYFYNRKILVLFLVLGTAVALILGYCTHNWNGLSKFLIHPIEQFNIFVFPLVFSVFISWESRDLKNKRENLQRIISTYTPISYDLRKLAKSKNNAHNDPDLANVLQRIEFCRNELQENYNYDLALFLLNIVFGGYTALCVSSALLQMTSSGSVV